MDDCEIVPFMSVVAGLLLCNSTVGARELVNFISELSSMGFEVADGDDLSTLEKCVDVDKKLNFSLKNEFGYDTLLENGKNVFQFLEGVAGSDVLFCINNDEKYCNKYENNRSLYYRNDQINNVNIKSRKRMLNLSLSSFISGFHL